ncbi:MAG: hypothetical protein M5U26_08395 [Planctomycetota bacterium]|nr:hypothetical protein [Planctomycetota bacterium]
MKLLHRFFFAAAVALLALATPVFAGTPSSGAITEGLQYINGTKIFSQDQLNVATLTGNATLDLGSKRFQKLNPSGAHRDVTLPAEELSAGLVFWFINSGSGNNVVVKDDEGNTIVTVQQDQAAFAVCSGTAWGGFAFGTLPGGNLQADGSVAGATGQAQDFGTNGIKADVLAESSSGVGIAADGVLLKDGFVGILDTGSDHRITIKTATNEGANYDLTIPDLAASDTLMTLATAQTVTGVKTMSGANVVTHANASGLKILDTGGDHTLAFITATDEAGNYTVTVPDLAGNDTLMTLATAQTVTGVKTMSGANVITHANASGLKILDTGGDHTLAFITATDEAADYTVTVPDLAGNDTLMTLATAQTVTGVKTMSGANVVTHANASGLKILDTGGDHTLAFITATDEAADYTVTVPDLAGNDTLMTLATAQTVTGVKTMSGANVITHANTGLKVLDTGGDHSLTITTGTNEAASYNVTIPDLSGNDTLMTLGVPGTVTGNVTYSGSVIRASQRYCFGLGGAKVGGTAGFVVGAASNVFAATCPASQTSAKLIVPIPAVKDGWTITGFGLLGQIESAGNNVTVDCDLRVQTTATGDFVDASVSTMTQIAVSADTAIDETQDKTGLSQAVDQDEAYYMVITVTTDASTDVDIRGVRLIVTEN